MEGSSENGNFPLLYVLKMSFVGDWVVQKSPKTPLRNTKMVPKGKMKQYSKTLGEEKKLPTLVFDGHQMYIMTPKLHELSMTDSVISFTICFT